jgi:LemA protein
LAILELIGIIILVVIVIAIIAIILLFNSLVGLRNRVRNAWSQIDVQLKKRFDLVPNLVETVKGYAKHEREVFENVTKARAMISQAKNIKENAEAQNMLAGALKTLFAVAENYPELKASQNFMMLQEELSGIESKIAYARQFYNDTVLQYNNSIQMFPNNIIAGMLGFAEQQFFGIAEAEKGAVKVSF